MRAAFSGWWEVAKRKESDNLILCMLLISFRHSSPPQIPQIDLTLKKRLERINRAWMLKNKATEYCLVVIAQITSKLDRGLGQSVSTDPHNNDLWAARGSPEMKNNDQPKCTHRPSAVHGVCPF